GYLVVDVADGARALDEARQRPEPVHLVITDVIMPGMSGPELARRIQSLHAAAKILFISGYTDQVLSDYEVLRGRLPLIPKPFAPDALLRKVREVLDSADAPAAIPADRQAQRPISPQGLEPQSLR
ncbi:MAG: response regulator, partial [Elusimicrobia bacterium]|nr:response regulator [Elusimicrobiota bacterium]